MGDTEIKRRVSEKVSDADLSDLDMADLIGRLEVISILRGISMQELQETHISFDFYNRLESLHQWNHWKKRAANNMVVFKAEAEQLRAEIRRRLTSSSPEAPYLE